MSDVGLLFATLQAGEDADLTFPDLRYAFDHRLPPVGTGIVVAGQRLRERAQVVNGLSRRLEIEREIVLRRGTVSENDPIGRYMGIGPNFTTTIPFPPGFSGSPVFNLGDVGEPLTLRGLVTSSGLGSPEAESDFRISGDGRCASVQSLLPLPVDAEGRYVLADLLRRGHFEDLSGELGLDGVGGASPTTELRLFPGA